MDLSGIGKNKILNIPNFFCSDLEIREERVDLRQSIKKPIQLKIKTSSNLIIPSNLSSNSQSSSSFNDSFHIQPDEKSSNSINFLSSLNWSYNV